MEPTDVYHKLEFGLAYVRHAQRRMRKVVILKALDQPCLQELRTSLEADRKARYMRQGLAEDQAAAKAKAETTAESAGELAAEAIATRRINCLPGDATAYEEELPVLWLYPKQWNGRAIVWLNDNGKSSLYEADGSVKPAVLQLVNSGATVVGADLLFQGEFLKDGEPVRRASAFRVGKQRRARIAFPFPLPISFAYHHNA